ncbi:MAG: efflux RND transporter periplasmic adaptor subunit [Candidatus Gracilibacteria bacterium]|nr:efflux RND transporter periplasmic adaptor subunit [Candidatus Gracilibacteria bacterium]
MLKKIFILLLLISLLTSLTSCGEEKIVKKIEKKYSTYTVKTGNIDISNKFTGYTSGIKEVMLATKSPGRITYLSKNIGDKVKSGELIASLDGAEAKVGYSTANNIVNSLYSLRKQTGLSFDAQISSIDTKIEQAKIGIKGVNTGLEDTKKITNSQLETSKSGIKQAELSIKVAENNLEETIKTIETNKKNILDGAKSAIIQSVILYKNIIDFSDKTLGITKENKRVNDKFEDYLGGKDSIQLKETETYFLKAKQDFDNYEKIYTDFIENQNPSEEEIIKTLKIAEKTAEIQKLLLKKLYTTLDNSIANIYFPEDIINEYKKNILLMGSQVENSLLTVNGNFVLGIKGSLQNLKTLNSEGDKGISLLEKQVVLANNGLEIAKKTYEQYLAMSKGEVNGVITKKEIAESQLKEAYSGLKAIKAQKEASLKEIDAKIAEAQGLQNSAGVMINNGKIYSNISGIITMKMAEIGQVINAGMPIYKVVDTSKLKVKTSVSNDIYKNLKIGQKINLAVEGYNKKITGKISSLNKEANKFTKKYDIEIIINNSKGKIPVGAMSIISIKNSSNSGKIKNKAENTIIPNNAIISKFGLPAVYVLENGKATLQNIKILKMGEKQSEVSGIKSLDIIITSGKENIYDGEVLENK